MWIGGQKIVNTITQKDSGLSGDGFFTLNHELVITYLDKTAAGLLGHPLEKLLGTSLFEVLPKVAAALKEGFNMVEGEEIFYISNPALGLWSTNERFKNQ